VGITGAALDVSEIKKSEGRFEAALEAVLDSVTIQQAVRSEGGDRRRLPDHLRHDEGIGFRGRGPRDLVGRTILDLYPPLRNTGFVDGYVDVLRTGRPLHLTALPYGKEGEVRRYDLVASRLADDELLVVWRDVTDRETHREASARAEAIRAIAEELQRGSSRGIRPMSRGLPLRSRTSLPTRPPRWAGTGTTSWSYRAPGPSSSWSATSRATTPAQPRDGPDQQRHQG